MDAWGDEVNTDPLPRGGVGDAQRKEIEQKEMNLSKHVKISSCQIRNIEKEMKNNLSVARRSDEFNFEETR